MFGEDGGIIHVDVQACTYVASASTVAFLAETWPSCAAAAAAAAAVAAHGWTCWLPRLQKTEKDCCAIINIIVVV